MRFICSFSTNTPQTSSLRSGSVCGNTGAYCTGITQNVDDLLQSHTARTMLANSEFIIMLNQASTDRIELAKLLNISDLQMSYITNVGAGQGAFESGQLPSCRSLISFHAIRSFTS